MLQDEESMHLFWFLTYLLLGPGLRTMVNMIFLIWAFLNTCEWFGFLMMRCPALPILPLFAGIIELSQDFCVRIVLTKNMLEVILIFSTLIMWTMGWCAPICGIVLAQALRIKFMGSHFTKSSFAHIDKTLHSLLPSIVYKMIVELIKNQLSQLSGINEPLEKV